MQLDTIISIKKEVIKALLEKLSEALSLAERQLEQARQGAIEAPGRMQSRYDSAKQEFSYLAESYQKRIFQIKNEISTLEEWKVRQTSKEIVDVGSLVETEEDRNKKKSFYFILPAGAGEIVKNRRLRKTITIISVKSPLAKELLNKRVGDSLVIASRKLTITCLH